MEDQEKGGQWAERGIEQSLVDRWREGETKGKAKGGVGREGGVMVLLSGAEAVIQRQDIGSIGVFAADASNRCCA